MAGITDQIRNRIKDCNLNPAGFKADAPAPPVSLESVAVDEKTLGFSLPPLLKELYTEIGNGGWGPGYGLLGLSGGAVDDTGLNAIESYCSRRAWNVSEAEEGWPEGLIPICHWGCAIYSCIACLKPSFPVVVFDPNIETAGLPGIFFTECDGLEEWMRLWAGGHDLWQRLYGENGPMLRMIDGRSGNLNRA